MKDRNTSLIATLAAVVLCGCPGLFGLCFGLSSLFASLVPGAQIDVLGSTDPQTATLAGLASFCVSVIFIAIPIVVWFVTRPKKTTAVSDISDLDQPPPAI